MEDHPKKKRGGVKVFKNCFCPKTAGEDDHHAKNSDHKVADEGRLGKPVLIAVASVKGKTCLFSDGKSVNGHDSDGGVNCYGKRSGAAARRRMACILKAVLFDIAVIRKIRNRRSSKSSSNSTSSSSSKHKNRNSFDKNNLNNEENSEADDCFSRRSNLLSSSSRTTSSVLSTSCSSSINSNSLSSSERKGSCRMHSLDFRPSILSSASSLPKISLSNLTTKPNLQVLSSLISLPKLNSPILTSSLNPFSKSITFNYSNGLNLRMCLLIIVSLFTLVMWGRVCSIFCTSIGFYLVPCHRVKRVDSAANTAKSIDMDSEQYKKKVIMEGLLDRTRNSG